MPHDINTCLSDIKESINSIYEYLGPKRDYNVYLRNKLLRRGVERELEIIGEATRRILRIDPAFKLENSKSIIGLRNFVSHAYDSIDEAHIWAIVINHLPKLRTEVESLLPQE
jgi:uncharacterized protein with HEPN domain